jgi:uncharacterized protein YvpB
MLTATIAALLAVVLVLIIAILLFGGWREHQRYRKAVAEQSTLPSHPLDRHVTAILHMQDGAIVDVETPKQVSFFSLPTSWYTRRRPLVTLGLLVMIALAFFVQGGLAGGDSVIHTITHSLGLSLFTTSQSNDLQPIAHAQSSTASSRVVRVNSAAADQYRTAYQLNVWSYSSCSGIAMEMVMNAYGRHYIASDILQEELNLGVWSTSLGLLREDGMAQTAAYFGFNADDNRTRSLQDVIDIANQGSPVIVSVRDSAHFPNGHIFVIHGGDDQYVYIADSSLDNFTKMTRAMFQGMWQTFSAVLTPKN